MTAEARDEDRINTGDASKIRVRNSGDTVPLGSVHHGALYFRPVPGRATTFCR